MCRSSEKNGHDSTNSRLPSENPVETNTQGFETGFSSGLIKHGRGCVTLIISFPLQYID